MARVLLTEEERVARKKEQKKVSQAKYRAKNVEKIKSSNKLYKESHKEQIKAQALKDSARRKEKRQKFRELNPIVRLTEEEKKQRALDAGKHRRKHKPEKCKEYQQRYSTHARSNLTDAYVKRLLIQWYKRVLGITGVCITPELINAQRSLLKAGRILKELENES